jgi:hypothetical protein
MLPSPTIQKFDLASENQNFRTIRSGDLRQESGTGIVLIWLVQLFILSF